ncbi:MAG: hypothetical protein AAFY56_22120 [Pseudomonadota bacterium]
MNYVEGPRLISKPMHFATLFVALILMGLCAWIFIKTVSDAFIGVFTGLALYAVYRVIRGRRVYFRPEVPHRSAIVWALGGGALYFIASVLSPLSEWTQSAIVMGWPLFALGMAGAAASIDGLIFGDSE